MDDSSDSFGFISTDAPFPLPITLGGTGATTSEVAAMNIIGPLPTVSELDEYDKVLIQQNSTAAIRKRRADAFAQDMWNLLYKDSEPTEDSTAPITSGAVAAAIAGNIDETLSVQGKAADAKATGEAIDGINKNIGAQVISWTEGAYIKDNYNAGIVVNLTPVSAAGCRCAVVDCAPGDKFTISVVGKASPRAWAFIDSENKMVLVSASYKTYVDFGLEAPANAAKLILNDVPDGGVFNTISIRGTYVHDEISATNSAVENNQNAEYGGENHLDFESGSASAPNNILIPSISDTVLRTKNLIPSALMVGDVVAVASGYEAHITQVHKTMDGYERYQVVTTFTSGIIRIPADGLYFVLLRRTDRAPISPEEGEALTVHHFASKVKLPGNPYKNIVWSSVQDVTSVTHAHCTTQAHFDTLKAHYDHVAISNYYPSIPYYPLSDFFQNTDGVIASPNAEQHGMSDVSGHVHLNGVGAYIMSGDKYDGTLRDMVDNALETLMYHSGGGVTLNHPKWSELDKAGIETILLSGGIIAMEIWNASCERNNQTGFSLDLWDAVLSDGIQVFGVAVPDHEAQYHPLEDGQPFGYNHLLVIGKTEGEILSAYRQGHYYTTLYNDGLTLENLSISSGTVSVEVSEESTITFITAARTVTASGTTATFAAQAGDVYVRVEASRGANRLFSNAIFL